MTARAPEQPKAGRRERTIIDRPRLIKLLDEADAKTILLLAPAGYGKTTLARQWAKPLQRPVWLSLTPAHRDVAALAHDLAEAIDTVGGEATPLIAQHLKAQSNPQRAAHELARALVGCLDSAGVQWLILDEYEDISNASGAEQLIEEIASLSRVRMLLTSRIRPGWATGRRATYRDVDEIRRAELAMTDEEAALVLKPRASTARIAQQAAGWPAVLGLAAAVEPASVPSNALPDALHRYLLEELYERASPELQDRLITIALLGDTSQSALRAQFGVETQTIISEAAGLGFTAGGNNGEFALHPLLREFLVVKLSEAPHAETRVDQAIRGNLAACAWESAFDLIVRFKRWDAVDGALREAFKPLVRGGRLGTLADFTAALDKSDSFPPSVVEVALAETALRDGRLDLARDLACRAEPGLGRDHPLRSRAAAIRAHATYHLCEWDEAVKAFERAQEFAHDDRDEAEAIFGLALTKTHGELDGAAQAVVALSERRNLSPSDLVRFVTADLSLRRLQGQEGLAELPRLDDARRAADYVDDPRIRSSLFYMAANLLAQSACYDDAQSWLDLALADIRIFALEFAWPLANWAAGQIALGQRHFAATERYLQSIEDAVARGGEQYHSVNARCLRARLLLQNGDAENALECVRRDLGSRQLPSWKGEYLATRAFALACLGNGAEALEAASLADASSIATEVRVLAQVARAISSVQSSEHESLRLIAMAQSSNVWDPVVCGLRSSAALADCLTSDRDSRPVVAELYQRTGDRGLARRAGLRVRATTAPDEILTDREFEVLGLIARGYRTQDIAKALFIAESTTKVHIRHVFDKLGARTRSEAVARYQMFEEARVKRSP